MVGSRDTRALAGVERDSTAGDVTEGADGREVGSRVGIDSRRLRCLYPLPERPMAAR